MSLKKSLEKLKAAIMTSEVDPNVSGDATTPQQNYDRAKKAAQERCEDRHPNDPEAYNKCMFVWYKNQKQGKCCCKTVGNECQCTVTVSGSYISTDSYSYTEPGACVGTSGASPPSLPGVNCFCRP